MNPSLPCSLLLCALPLIPAPAFAQCGGATLDTLDGISAIAVDERPGAARVVLAQRNWFELVPRFDVFELPGNDVFTQGQVMAISGERVAALSGQSLNRPLRLEIIERAGGTGAWAIVDQVVLQNIFVPWFDYPLYLDLEGDVAAVSSESNASTIGCVVVCERGMNGAWSETARLGPPSHVATGGFVWSVRDLAVHGDEVAVIRSTSNGAAQSVLHLYRRVANGEWAIVERLSLDAVFGSAVASTELSVAFDGDDRVAVSTRQEALVFSRDAGSGRLVNPHTVHGLGLAVGFTGAALVGGDYRARVVDVPVGPGMTEVCSLAGLSTCAGSGSSSLRVHDGNPWVAVRKATAEVLDAQPGATVVVFVSDDPASSPAQGGQLCIDRRAAVIAGTPIQASAQGTASFALRTVGTSFGELGFGASDHLQAVVFRAAPELTNAMAWIP